MNKKLVIFGAGPIGELAHYYFTNDSEYQVSGFVVDADYRDTDKFCNLPMTDYEKIEQDYPASEYDLFIAMSYSHLNEARKNKYLDAKSKGYTIASYISSKATVLTDKIGDNAFILEDNTIQPFVTIGNNVTLWSGNHIGHHGTIEDHVFIASHIVMSGNCVIGESSFVGVNATLRDGIKIGKKNIIGMAAVIARPTDDEALYKPVSTKPATLKSTDIKL